MKKILLFLTLLFIPFIAKAELKELELVNQYNTGYSETYYVDGYFVLLESIYDSYNNYAFAAMDVNGNYLYEKPAQGSGISFYDGKNIFYIYCGQDDKIHMEKYEPKTGNKIAELSYDSPAPDSYSYEIYNLEDSFGVDFHHARMNNIVVKKDLSSYEEVENIQIYTKVPVIPNIDYIPEAKANSFLDFLNENNVAETNIVPKVVLFNNQYYTFTVNSKTLRITPNIIYADQNLTDYDLISINNNGFYDGSTNPGDYARIQYLVPYQDKLMAVINYSEGCQVAQGPNQRYGGNCVDDTYVQIYRAKFTITTKTDGNGTIKVSKNEANMSDEITIEIEPKEGYVLGEVKVTDALGNVLIFKDYKFTMPSADVLVEVTFVPYNPNTKDIIITTIAILLVSFISIVVIKVKEKELS